MKLCFSAIAWNADEEKQVLAFLQSRGLKYIEHVLGRIAQPESARAFYAGYGMQVAAFQALLYGTRGLSVFGSDGERADLLSHLEGVFVKAGLIGARALVFGAPKNRWVDQGKFTPSQARQAGLEFFRAAGAAAARHSVVFCIEPNPPQYGCNFISSTAEAIDFLDEAAADGLGLNLDGGTIIINGEDPPALSAGILRHLAHVHISEPDLAALRGTSNRGRHREIAAMLAKSSYDGVVSLEMARPGEGALLDELEAALEFAGEVYDAA